MEYSNLFLVISGSINYEWQASHTITVECADKGELTCTKVFNVTVLNGNDPPTGIQSEVGFTINENMPASTRIAVLKTIDEDLLDHFSYCLLSYSDKFIVVGMLYPPLPP